QPADRVRFQAPVQDVVLVQHQNDASDPTTGATLPVRCDPDPQADGPGTRYRTAPNLESGAGPLRLRGVFAFAILSTGDIVTIDVDDYDAPCRGPSNQTALRGCDGVGMGLVTSGEFSCNAVAPHEP